jgi:LPXTG-site transpeptidase (sortase) family protein
MRKEEVKKLFKPLILLFLINFLIMNWNDVSWMFNYRVITGVTSKFLEILDNKKDVYAKTDEKDNPERENSLEIPKIEVSAPLIVAEDLSQKYLDNELDRGVVIFPNSVLPGEIGQTIILGHSAPPNWPKINYDGVFSRIAELEEKDEIVLYFNNQKYIYYVDEKIFLEKGEEIPDNLNGTDSALLLISCWPPGKNIRRIVIEAKLIKN